MMKKVILLLAALMCLLLAACGANDAREEVTAKPNIYIYPEEEPVEEKPAIYLYPEEETAEPEAPEKPVVELYPENALEVTVKLDFDGTLTCTYPAYNDGWTVTAYPDGTLVDETGREYNYLFWEGIANKKYPAEEGFVVAGADTEAFLEEKLAILGLSDREAGDFITYWLPRMQGNAYNLITFQTEAYTEIAKLEITPEPDSLIRVFMTFKALEAPIEVPEQTLVAPERTGFVAVEWGGAELK